VARPEGREAIVEAIRNILAEGGVHSITVSADHPIRYRQWAEGAEQEITAGDVARNVPMMEIFRSDSRETFLGAFASAAARGLHITHIGVGTSTAFWEWLGLDGLLMVGTEFFCGASIVHDESIPEHSVLFFIGPYQDGRLEDVTKILRAPVEEAHGRRAAPQEWGDTGERVTGGDTLEAGGSGRGDPVGGGGLAPVD